MVDLAYIVPTWLMLDCTPNNYIALEFISGYFNRLVWICFLLKTARTLRCLRLRPRVMDMFENEVQQSIGGMIVFILTIVVFSKFNCFLISF